MNKDDLLTEFNEGGSHAENPLGGIPQGTAPDGLPNSVEEGETKLTVGDTKYVFSDRLNTKNSYVDAYALPTYIKGKSFAEASKLINKRFEDRNDNASNSTKKVLLSRLLNAQEMAKLEKAAAEVDLSVPDYLKLMAEQKAQEQMAQDQQAMAQQESAQGQNGDVQAQGGTEQPPQEEMPQNADMQPPQGQMAEGGAIAGSAVSGGLGMITSAASDLEAAKGDKEVRDKMSVGGTAAKYAAMGAAAGSIVPGVGTAIGAGAGAIIGGGLAIANNSHIPGEQQEADQKLQGEKLMKAGYRAAYGGYQYAKGGPVFDEDLFNEGEEADMVRQNEEFNKEQAAKAANSPGVDLLFEAQNERRPVQFAIDVPTPKGVDLSGVGSYSDDLVLHQREPGTYQSEEEGSNDSGWSTYAGIAAGMTPFLGNLYEGANLELDEPTRYERVGRTYTPNFADERKQMNAVNESYAGVNDSIANATNGNLGAYRANLLGANINKSKAISDAYGRVNDINRAEEAKLGEDYAAAARENVALSNQEKLEKQQNEAAYDAAKRKYRTAAYEGLGELGKTIFGVSQMEGMTPYGITGKRKSNK